MLSFFRTYLQRKPRKPDGKPLSYPVTHPAHSVLERLGEYNPKIQGREWFLTVDKMRNNSRIMALEYILTLPIISTHWEVYPARGAGRLGKEAAALLQRDLFEGSLTTLHEVLRLGVLARFYGFRALEPVWGVGGGRVVLVDVADIHPTTYQKIEFGERGEPLRLVQRVVTARGRVEEVALEWGDLLVFTWRREGGDPLGYADLRALYPDWYRLEFLYSVLGVAAERAGIGAWQATLPRNLYDNEALRREILNILKSIRSYEGGALIVPEGVSIEVLRAVEQQGIRHILDIAQHYETNLATAILANILQLGMRDVGTQALASVLFDMFLFQLNHTARWLADTINTQLVRRWCAYNYPQMPAEEQPNLQYADLRLLLKREAVVEVLVKTIQAGMLPVDGNLQEYVRDLLSLPPAGGGEVLQNLGLFALTPDPSPSGRGGDWSARAELSAQQGRSALLAREREGVRSREAQFAESMRRYLEVVERAVAPQVEALLQRVREARDEGERSAAVLQLTTIELEGREAYEAMVRDYLILFAQEARAALARDYNPEIAPDRLPDSLMAYIWAKAAALARDHQERLRSQIVYNALAEALRATPVLSAAELVRNVASQRLNTDLGRLEDEARLVLERVNEEL